MNSNLFLKAFSCCLFLTFLGIIGCNDLKNKKPVKVSERHKISVFNFDDKQQLQKYNKLKLDDDHPNLLNPQISQSDFNSVKKSWIDLHQAIGMYMDKKGFEWEVQDSSITVVHKFYFTSDGQVENYFFNVINESVTSEKKNEFGDLISGFARDFGINYQSEESFAQCGKTKYLSK
ncbi:hypothetical protein SAMN05192588_2856 [Nonlabens sp. Hel1_33_55]|uniref:hypothetical protein n=1 Tax=Nonlabens sp. Hel1_33_55 TaxID=1336802 RepID=UPI000875E223|nr:hypothetical protein [Nonlabens sp. Hel1_33_55]SCY43211.1 hypothetical protein SAMN05192588_2856 [Nonlabens sp. Hel1_33_55]